jgi:hypothetical protein
MYSEYDHDQLHMIFELNIEIWHEDGQSKHIEHYYGMETNLAIFFLHRAPANFINNI